MTDIAKKVDLEIPAPPEKFFSLCTAAGLKVGKYQEEILGRYLALMLDTNRNFNLTSVRDPNEAWVRHIYDSLLLLSSLDDAKRIIDIGSGAGLPGIPLAVMKPGLQVTLLESTRKKANFLDMVAGELGLGNIEVLCARAEDAGRDPGHRGRYHAAVVRAVGSMAELIELGVPLLKEQGVLLAVKGAGVEEDVRKASRALQLLKARVEGIRKVGEGDAVSWIVAVRKTGSTPAGYPRLPGTPKKTPL
ncbi:MAG: 16S rRNA (guanine(527)-N(7))-methyltransferase RsmG [Kiritimatiellia bacterium]